MKRLLLLFFACINVIASAVDDWRCVLHQSTQYVHVADAMPSPWRFDFQARSNHKSQNNTCGIVGSTDQIIKQYLIDAKTIACLGLSKSDVETVSFCIGSLDQLNIHAEFVDVIRALSVYVQSTVEQTFKSLAKETAQLAVSGCELSKCGEVTLAQSVLRVCQGITSLISAVGSGVKKGLRRGVHTVVHPIQTLKNLAYSVSKIGELIGGLLIDDPEDAYSMLSRKEKDEIWQIRQQHLDQFQQLCAHFYKKVSSMSVPDLVEAVTAYVIEGLLLAYIPKICTRGCKLIRSGIKYRRHAPQKIHHADDLVLILNPDGTVAYAPKQHQFMEVDPWWNRPSPVPVVLEIELLESPSFLPYDALEHLFYGQIKNGLASGFHYEGLPGSRGAIVRGTRETVSAELDIYRANVTVDGILKKSFSTFFPQWMTPQQVVDAVLEAYHNRVYNSGNKYQGVSNSGIIIEMYIDKKGRVITAFPSMVQKV